MSIIIQTRFESAVTDADKYTYTCSYMEDRKTVTEFDMRNVRTLIRLIKGLP